MPKKQKDNRYRAKVTIPGVGPVYVSAKTVRELEEKKQAVRARLTDNSRRLNITFHQLVIEWWTAFKQPRIKSQSTENNYRCVINCHVLPFFPEKQLLRAVQRKDLQTCLDACAGKSASTVTKTHSVLRGAIHYALAEGLLSVDISASLFEPEKSVPEEKHALTSEQRAAVLRTISESPDGIMFALLYYLGIRRGEMLGLKWGDVDFNRRFVRIQRSVSYLADKNGTLHAPKTERSKRIVPMPQELVNILLPLHGKSESYVCSADNGKHVLPSSVFAQKWARLLLDSAPALCQLAPDVQARMEAAQKQGRKPETPSLRHENYQFYVTPHTFRHNYITACVAAGFPPEVTMRLVGHTSYQTTVNIYTHLQEKEEQLPDVDLSQALDAQSTHPSFAAPRL